VRPLKYALELRLRFIDFLLHEYGSINRSAITDYFAISTPQASHDLQQYAQLAPDNMTYDPVARTYRRALTFKRVWL
jgi:hypothetical protein